MPTHLLLRIAWQHQPNEPKNQFVINPCFRRQMDITDPLSGTDAQQLCDDLATAIKAWQATTTNHVKVTAYNLQGAPPHYPLASKEFNPTNFWALNAPGQLACCLSYYGTQNIPRQRGRLYVPANVATPASTEIASGTPNATTRTKVAALVPIFANLGGTNVDWIVWSRVGQSATKVQNHWVDDSWDIIRSRKIKATTRLAGTTSG